MQPGCILVCNFGFSSIRCITQKELLELPATVFFSVNHARILGVPCSLTRLEKSPDKRHGRASYVRSHINHCCAGDSWSGLMAQGLKFTSSSWAGCSVASFGELHFPLPPAPSPWGSCATQQGPLPWPSRLRAGGVLQLLWGSLPDCPQLTSILSGPALGPSWHLFGSSASLGFTA